jgi:hypothetical protein
MSATIMEFSSIVDSLNNPNLINQSDSEEPHFQPTTIKMEDLEATQTPNFLSVPDPYASVPSTLNPTTTLNPATTVGGTEKPPPKKRKVSTEFFLLTSLHS